MTYASDRATATFAPEQIGRHRYVTPEGFVLWEGVRLARVGPMLYAPDEMPDIAPGSNGMVVIERDADTLFDPEAMLSFSGKSVTNDHPNSPVCPVTYKGVSVGTVLNPRRGEGVEADYLIGDLLITDAKAIADIDAGKREVSAGYDVEVEEIKPGLGRQTKIVGNHVALVKRGRAGPSCAIQDKEPEMPRKRTIFDRLRTAIKAKDEAAIEAIEAELLDEDTDEPQRVVVDINVNGAEAPEAKAADEDTDPVEARFTKIEDSIATIAAAVEKLASPPATDEAPDDDDKTEATDEESEEVEKTTAMDAMSKAEILAPGIRMPVFDGAKVKSAAVTALRRKALRSAFANDARRPHVEAVLGGRKADFDAMKPSVVAVVFDAAAALTKAANNAHAVRDRHIDVPQGPMSAARYQQRILERRKAQA